MEDCFWSLLFLHGMGEDGGDTLSEEDGDCSPRVTYSSWLLTLTTTHALTSSYARRRVSPLLGTTTLSEDEEEECRNDFGSTSSGSVSISVSVSSDDSSDPSDLLLPLCKDGTFFQIHFWLLVWSGTSLSKSNPHLSLSCSLISAIFCFANCSWAASGGPKRHRETAFCLGVKLAKKLRELALTTATSNDPLLGPWLFSRLMNPPESTTERRLNTWKWWWWCRGRWWWWWCRRCWRPDRWFFSKNVKKAEVAVAVVAFVGRLISILNAHNNSLEDWNLGISSSLCFP